MLTEYITDAVVVHCIDYRLQGFLNRWLETNLPARGYDRVAIAGGVRELETVIRQVEIALRLHRVKKAILINHEDCGAYGAEGNYERHKADLDAARRRLMALFPELAIETYYLHLEGEFEALPGPDR